MMQSKNPGYISSNGPGCASSLGLDSRNIGSGLDARCESDGTLLDPMSDSPEDFWKELPDDAQATLERIYSEVVHWKSHHFDIYNNKIDKKKS